jgi:hypothetical protein
LVNIYIMIIIFACQVLRYIKEQLFVLLTSYVRSEMV